MADDNSNNQSNQQQNQNKQKGGGGGGSGLSLTAKFDASAPGGVDNLKNQIVGHASNSIGFIVGAAVAGVVYLAIKKQFKIVDAPPQQQGGGQMHPGQLTGELFKLKKADPARFQEIMGKVNPVIDVEPSK